MSERRLTASTDISTVARLDAFWLWGRAGATGLCIYVFTYLSIFMCLMYLWNYEFLCISNIYVSYAYIVYYSNIDVIYIIYIYTHILYICVFFPKKRRQMVQETFASEKFELAMPLMVCLSRDIPNEKSPLDVPNSSPINCWFCMYFLMVFLVETYKIPSKSQISAETPKRSNVKSQKIEFNLTKHQIPQILQIPLKSYEILTFLA